MLAASTAVAYAIAYAHESGFADYHGYPHWMIELDVTTVATAWVALAGAVGGVYFLFAVILGSLPVTFFRGVRALVRYDLSRTAIVSVFAAGMLGWLIEDLGWVAVNRTRFSGQGGGLIMPPSG